MWEELGEGGSEEVGERSGRGIVPGGFYFFCLCLFSYFSLLAASSLGEASSLGSLLYCIGFPFVEVRGLQFSDCSFWKK